MPDFQFMGEMGPVADLSTFPPTMVDPMQMFGQDSNQLLTMDSILGDGTFWDNVLVPGKDAGDDARCCFVHMIPQVTRVPWRVSAVVLCTVPMALV